MTLSINLKKEELDCKNPISCKCPLRMNKTESKEVFKKDGKAV